MDLSKMQDFGSIVRAERTSKGMTLKQVADSMGYTLAYQSEIERGIKRPTRERVIALSNLLGLNSSETLEMVYPEMIRKVHLDECLRHGSVLAEGLGVQTVKWSEELSRDERAAITFFEKFGGNDE